MDSILLTIKKMLGIEAEFDGFDIDIITALNTAFMSLNQLGVGPATTFVLTGIDETWADFLGTSTNIEGIKSYLFLKARLLFDPPANSFAITSMENQIKELEWRLNVISETTV